MTRLLLSAGCVAVLSATTVSGAWNYGNQAPVWPPPSAYSGVQFGSIEATPVEAVAGSNPTSITLRIIDPGTYNIFRKVAGAASWVSLVANVDFTSGQTWTDTGGLDPVLEGVMYEYRIVKTSTNAAGYILAGVKVDQTQPKGRFVIVVTSDVVATLPAEYEQYKTDLVADGWTVHEIVTPRAADYFGNGGAHVAIRDQIIAIYNQYPGQVKNLLLLGKVPVVRTGTLFNGPDGHGNVAAVGADAYYADMDGVWTDTKTNAYHVVNPPPAVTTGFTNNADFSVTFSPEIEIASSTLSAIQSYRSAGLSTTWSDSLNFYKFTITNGELTAIRPVFHPSYPAIPPAASKGTLNVPGDNKFDAISLSQITPNANVELGFGRIDMSSSVPNEYEALRNYFNKAHRYKTASPDFLPGRRAMNRIQYASVWNNAVIGMPGVVGMNNLDFLQDTDLPAVPNGDYDPDAAYTTTHPALFYFKGSLTPGFSSGSKAVFWSGLQSHWGYWYSSSVSSGSNVMQRRLSEDNFTLSYTWSVFYTYYLYQRMGLGYDLGDMMRYSISSKPWSAGASRPLYFSSASASGLFMEEMGDPSLRAFMFAPPTELSVVPTGGTTASLSWTASRPPPSNEPQVIGYHVYRAATPAGPFSCLTPGAPVTGTIYMDNPMVPGSFTYMVRAVRLETTGAGSFYNASLGVSQSVELPGPAATLQVSTSSLADSTWNAFYSSRLAGTGGVPVYAWSLVSGSLPPGLNLASDGTISGTSTGSGIYSFTVQATDKLDAIATKALSLTAQSNGSTTVIAEAGNFVTTSSPTASGSISVDPGMKVAGPTYGYITFLRFDLSGVNFNNGLVRAKLRLSMGDATPTSTYALVKAALGADAGDGWNEYSITYNTKPADNPLFTPISASGYPAPYGTLDFDLTPFVQETLASDLARKLTVRLFTSFPLVFASPLVINSRFAPGNAKPQIVIESTDAPAITVSSPTVSPATINFGSALQINTTVIPIPPRAASTMLQWSMISGPGTATFANGAQPSTGVTFSAAGDYVVRLTADDGVLQSYKDVVVRVLATPTGTAAVAGSIDHLLLRLALDESTGIIAKDTSAAAPITSGTVSGNPVWSGTSGRIGGALTQDGSGDRITVPDSSVKLLDGVSQMSISFWIKPADTIARGLVTKLATTSSGVSYNIAMISGGKLQADFGQYVAASTNRATGGTALALNSWHHVVAVFDGSLPATGPRIQLYLNGDTEKFQATTVSSVPRNAASPVRVGGNNTDTSSFNGSLDEVRIYDKALTLPEIQDLYSATPSNIGPVIATAPVVSGTANQAFTLAATVTDDGKPTPPGALTLGWSKFTGTGSVIFGTPASASTTATASLGGAYVLRLSASDGGITTFADVTANIVGGLTAYQQWLQTNGLPMDGSGNGALSATPLNDGVTNAMKYALGIGSNVQGYGGKVTTGKVTDSGSEYLSLTYVIPDPAPTGVIYTVKTGSDMVIWTAAETQVVSNIASGGLRTVTVRDTKAMADPEQKRFIRLEVVVP